MTFSLDSGSIIAVPCEIVKTIWKLKWMIWTNEIYQGLFLLPQGDVMEWNMLRVTSPLWGESTGYLWIPFTKAIEAELRCFPWSAPEQGVEQTIDTPVVWDAIALIMTSL